MNIGDLVTLSAYGRKKHYNGGISEGDIGLITRISRGSYPYQVEWIKSRSSYSMMGHSRRELRYANTKR